MTFRTIPGPADADAPPVNPPCSGNWQRLEDGSLRPADEATARSAGLFDEPAPQAPEVEA